MCILLVLLCLFRVHYPPSIRRVMLPFWGFRVCKLGGAAVYFKCGSTAASKHKADDAVISVEVINAYKDQCLFSVAALLPASMREGYDP